LPKDSEAGIESDDESFLSKSSRKARSPKKEEPSKPVTVRKHFRFFKF
jgi:hypothetical protein